MQSKLDATQEMLFICGYRIVSIGRCPSSSRFSLGCLVLCLSLRQFRTPFFLLARLWFLELVKRLKKRRERKMLLRWLWCMRTAVPLLLRKEKPIFCYNGGTVQTVMSAETKAVSCGRFAKNKGSFLVILAVGWREKWEWVLTGRV